MQRGSAAAASLFAQDTLVCASPGCGALRRVHRPRGPPPGPEGAEAMATAGLRVWVVTPAGRAGRHAAHCARAGGGLAHTGRPGSELQRLVPDELDGAQRGAALLCRASHVRAVWPVSVWLGLGLHPRWWCSGWVRAVLTLGPPRPAPRS